MGDNIVKTINEEIEKLNTNLNNYTEKDKLFNEKLDTILTSLIDDFISQLLTCESINQQIKLTNEQFTPEIANRIIELLQQSSETINKIYDDDQIETIKAKIMNIFLAKKNELRHTPARWWDFVKTKKTYVPSPLANLANVLPPVAPRNVDGEPLQPPPPGPVQNTGGKRLNSKKKHRQKTNKKRNLRRKKHFSKKKISNI
jgi:hypothetical protein